MFNKLKSNKSMVYFGKKILPLFEEPPVGRLFNFLDYFFESRFSYSLSLFNVKTHLYKITEYYVIVFILKKNVKEICSHC